MEHASGPSFNLIKVEGGRLTFWGRLGLHRAPCIPCEGHWRRSSTKQNTDVTASCHEDQHTDTFKGLGLL